MTTLPTHLYKYRSITPLLSRALVDHEVWLAEVASFNDPFDCAPYIHSNMTTNEVRDSLRRTINRNMAGASRRERLQELKSLMEHHPLIKNKRLGTTKGDRMLTKVFSRTIDQSGVLSLSEANDVVLMWSHYANNHRGVCIRYDTTDPIFKAVGRVVYSKDRPSVNPTTDGRKGMAKAILTKAEYWSYEQEWRVLSSRYNGPRKIGIRMIDGITFGARTSLEDEELVRDWAYKGDLIVEWSRAVFDEHQFKLNMETLEPRISAGDHS